MIDQSPFEKIKSEFEWGDICFCEEYSFTPYPHTHKFKSIFPENGLVCSCGGKVFPKSQIYGVAFGYFNYLNRLNCTYYICEFGQCEKCMEKHLASSPGNDYKFKRIDE